jgi:plasmid maintenance system antidote protein VapI
MMHEEVKYKVITLLQQHDLTARMISEELDISYSAVLRLEKQYNEAKMNGTVNKLINIDEAVLITAADALGLESELAGELTKGLVGLERLATEFQATALQINTKARSLIMSVEHTSELVEITDMLCKLNTSFVNSNQTQVNVQNNFGGEQNAPSRYSQYLSDTPVS